MKTQRLSRRWQRQHRKLLERQRALLRRCRSTGQRNEVHDLRVVLRRLRLMLRIAGSFLDSDSVGQFDRWSHQVLNATSRLRDCDAVLEWLARRADAETASEELARHRESLWRKAHPALSPLPYKTSRRLARISLTDRQKVRLEERFEDYFNRLEKAIKVRAPEFLHLNAEEQHTFRRKLRRLRYLREIARPRRVQRTEAWLIIIVQLQTAMGECQNLTIAEQLLARRGGALLSSALLEAMSRERVAWEKEIHRSLRKLRRLSWR